MSGSRQRSSGQARNRKRSGGLSLPGWAWGLGGLATGLLVAFAVHLHYSDQRGSDLSALLENGSDAPEAASGEASAEEGTRGGEGGDKPRFEFYRLLPEQKVSVPDSPGDGQRAADPPPETPEPPDAPGPGTATAAAESAVEEEQDPESQPAPSPSAAAASGASASYLLQAGSFRSFADADRMKASLALLGVQARVQEVQLSGGETWHRVRIGPFADRTRVNDVRRRLRANDIDAILLKRDG